MRNTLGLPVLPESTVPRCVDLAKALSRLAKLLTRTAQDIVTELHSSERTHQVTTALEETARHLRERAQSSRLAVIVVDPGG